MISVTYRPWWNDAKQLDDFGVRNLLKSSYEEFDWIFLSPREKIYIHDDDLVDELLISINCPCVPTRLNNLVIEAYACRVNLRCIDNDITYDLFRVWFESDIMVPLSEWMEYTNS